MIRGLRDRVDDVLELLVIEVIEAAQDPEIQIAGLRMERERCIAGLDEQSECNLEEARWMLGKIESLFNTASV